jgi:hypothetical protein
MNCYTSGIVGIGMLGATFATMSVSEEQHNELKKVFSPKLDAIYDNIISERRNQYIHGILIGVVIAYVLLRNILKVTNMFHRISFFVAVTTVVSVLYYSLMPKSDYMLNHLKTPEENKAWLEMYKTMRSRYIIGFVLGSLSAIPIAYTLC